MAYVLQLIAGTLIAITLVYPEIVYIYILALLTVLIYSRYMAIAKTLTPRMKEVRDWIILWQHTERVSPSLRQLAKKFDVSKRRAQQFVECLSGLGEIETSGPQGS